MKIIHSFWSKPSTEPRVRKFEDRQMGGWLDKRYYYMSWVLSCLQFKKYYQHVELVTDSNGKQLLKDYLELPYDDVKVDLDSYNNFHPDLWAISKLHAYTIQTEPFLHVDSDVFIWDRLREVENKPLIAQNEDIGFEFYYKVWKEIQKHFLYIPEYMNSDYNSKLQINSCNAGIFGGTDVAFIKEFACEALEFLNKNISNYSGVNLGSTVLIYEQYLFSSLARSKKKEVSYLFDQMSSSYLEVSTFSTVPSKRKYVHLVGSAKRNKIACENLEYRLRFEYPDYYYYVLELLEKGFI